MSSTSRVVPLETDFEGADGPPRTQRIDFVKWGLIGAFVIEVLLLCYVLVALGIFTYVKPEIEADVKEVTAVKGGFKVVVGVWFKVPWPLKRRPKHGHEGTFKLTTYVKNQSCISVTSSNYSMIENEVQMLKLEFQLQPLETGFNKKVVTWFRLSGKFEMLEMLAAIPFFPQRPIHPKFDRNFGMVATDSEHDNVRSKRCRPVGDEEEET